MPEIINRQRKIKIETGGFQKFAEQAVSAINEAKGRDLTVAFVSDAASKSRTIARKPD